MPPEEEMAWVRGLDGDERGTEDRGSRRRNHAFNVKGAVCLIVDYRRKRPL